LLPKAIYRCTSSTFHKRSALPWRSPRGVRVPSSVVYHDPAKTDSRSSGSPAISETIDKFEQTSANMPIPRNESPNWLFRFNPTSLYQMLVVRRNVDPIKLFCVNSSNSKSQRPGRRNNAQNAVCYELLDMCMLCAMKLKRLGECCYRS
jgi:hypothetical protein